MIKGSSKVEAKDLGAPDEIWVRIAAFLSAIDLNRFVRSAKLFKEIGTDHTVTKPVVTTLYNRLRQLDISLPDKLITEDLINEYLATLHLVGKKQEKELNYLRKHHPIVVAKHMNIPELAKMSLLNRLEAIHQALNQINIDIITPSIDHQTKVLNLEKIHITRIPQQLFTDPNHSAFFNQLEELNCNENYIKVLALSGLPSLRILDCENNTLETLKLGELPALADLDCIDNRLRGVLDLTRFKRMYALRCHNNKLSTINVIGLHLLEHLDCSLNHLTKLEIDSPVLKDLKCNDNRLTLLSIKHIAMLQNTEDSCVHISDNHLKEIPQNLIDKFGAEFAEEAYQDQRTRDSDPSPSEQDSDYRANAWQEILKRREQLKLYASNKIQFSELDPLLKKDDATQLLKFAKEVLLAEQLHQAEASDPEGILPEGMVASEHESEDEHTATATSPRK